MEEGKLGEDEENFKILRLELGNLYSNTLLISDTKERAIQIINDKLTELNISVASKSQIELPLFLVTQMHSMIMKEDKDLVTLKYQNLITQLLKIDFISLNQNSVSILFFEICVKFASYFVKFPQHISQVLEILMSEKGVLHKSARVASRSSYFLLRFIDRLKNQMSECAELIFDRAREIIKFAEEGQTQMISNDIENFYEIIGSIMVNFHMKPTQVKENLAYYFELICHKINSFSHTATESIVEN